MSQPPHPLPEPFEPSAPSAGSPSLSPASEPAWLEYRSAQGPRKPGGLIAFGVIFCVLAAGAGCISLATPLALFIPPSQAAANRPSVAMVLVGIAIYAVAAAGLVILAIACLRGRRWVRPVSLALAWPMVIMSLWTIPIAAISAGMSNYPPGTPAGVRIVTVAGMVIVGGALFFALPLALILYFRREELRRRLMDYDPRPNWTDGRPIPVLSLAIWMGLMAISRLGVLAAPAIPAFGIVLTGWSAALALLLAMAILAMGAWQVYQKRLSGWWIAVGVVGVYWLSALVSVLRLGGEAMAMTAAAPAQREAMRGNPMLATPVQIGLNLVGFAALIAVLLWIRRFFADSTDSRA